MIDVHFVLLAMVITLAGIALYARDTVRGLTEPNRVTWIMWAIAPMLAFVSELHQGVGLQAAMTFMYGFCPLVVLAASFVNTRSVWHLGPFDIGCGVASAGGFALWLITANDTVALASFIVADLLAGLPTIVKAWKQPETESSSAFITGSLASLITLATVTTWTSAQVAFPTFVLIMNLALVTLVAGRLGPRIRREAPEPEIAPLERVIGGARGVGRDA